MTSKREAQPKPNPELSKLIRSRRQELQMSQKTFARLLNVPCHTLKEMESGRHCLSRHHDLIVRLAQILGLKVGELIAIRPKSKHHTKDYNPRSLDGWLYAKRVELILTQAKLGKLVGVSTSAICEFEKGLSVPPKHILGKLAKVFGCEIPPELILSFSRPISVRVIFRSNKMKADLEKIKRLSGIRSHTKVVRKALKILLILLEKQKGNAVI